MIRIIDAVLPTGASATGNVSRTVPAQTAWALQSALADSAAPNRAVILGARPAANDAERILATVFRDCSPADERFAAAAERNVFSLIALEVADQC